MSEPVENLHIEEQYKALLDCYQESKETTQLLWALLETDNSAVLCAPPSTSKRFSFDLATVRMLQTQHKVEEQLPKAIYVASNKTLCNEQFQNWHSRFLNVNVKCANLAGDHVDVDEGELADVQVIVTTVEKWEALTRQGEANKSIINAVRLLLIDNAHLVNDVKLGPSLEALVARARMHAIQTEAPLRVILTTATVPNLDDFVVWLRSGKANVEIIKVLFAYCAKPAQVHHHVIGFSNRIKQPYLFDIQLQFKLPDLIATYGKNGSTLIFCPNRNSVESAAKHLLEQGSGTSQLSAEERLSLEQESLKLQQPNLVRAFKLGIGFAHAGISVEERSHIQSCFGAGLLRIMICTPALPLPSGLKVPLVIVKSTKIYCDTGYKDYEASRILAMVGYADRMALIMTTKDDVPQYKRLLSPGGNVVESHLLKNLAEHLNANIALGLISDFVSAGTWLRCTFLYVRATQLPIKYDVGSQDCEKDTLEDLMQTRIYGLEDINAIKVSVGEEGVAIKSTAHGRLLSQSRICCETLTQFQKLHDEASLPEIITLLSECKEFSQFPLRVREKMPLKAINKDWVRFSLPKCIKESPQKISCLWQAGLENYEPSHAGLQLELPKIMKLATHLSLTLLQFVEALGPKGQRYQLLLNSMLLAKSMRAQMWADSWQMARQLYTVDAEDFNTLSKHGGRSFSDLLETPAEVLGKILKKSPAAAVAIHQEIRERVPNYDIHLLRVDPMKMRLRFSQRNTEFQASDSETVTILVGDTANNILFIRELSAIFTDFETKFKISSPEPAALHANVVHSQLVGVDYSTTFPLKSNAQPIGRLNAVPTQLTVTQLWKRTVAPPAPRRILPAINLDDSAMSVVSVGSSAAPSSELAATDKCGPMPPSQLMAAASNAMCQIMPMPNTSNEQMQPRGQLSANRSLIFEDPAVAIPQIGDSNNFILAPNTSNDQHQLWIQPNARTNLMFQESALRAPTNAYIIHQKSNNREAQPAQSSSSNTSIESGRSLMFQESAPRAPTSAYIIHQKSNNQAQSSSSNTSIESGPTDDEFMKWYKAALSFKNKPRDQHNYIGFKQAYYECNPPIRVAARTAIEPPSAKRMRPNNHNLLMESKYREDQSNNRTFGGTTNVNRYQLSMTGSTGCPETPPTQYTGSVLDASIPSSPNISFDQYLLLYMGHEAGKENRQLKK